MKNIILLFFLTLILLLSNYLLLEYRLAEYGLIILSLVVLIILTLYKNEIKITVEFNSMFLKYLGYSISLMLVLMILLKNKFTYILPEINTLFIIGFFFIPFYEELFYRFFIFEKLKKLSPIKVIFFSSFLFAIAHIFADSFGLLYIFLHSLIFSTYYYKSKNLLMVYLMHLSLNVIGTFIH